MPNTNVNQAKLKVILKQLKRLEKEKSSFSARGDS